MSEFKSMLRDYLVTSYYFHVDHMTGKISKQSLKSLLDSVDLPLPADVTDENLSRQAFLKAVDDALETMPGRSGVARSFEYMACYSSTTVEVSSDFTKSGHKM